MESFLGRNFFQNPFGGAMNPSGGTGGGVLEQIQEQVNTNGETLQSLQGGIGGLPSGNLPPGGIGGGHRGPGSPGTVKPSPIQGGGSTPAPPSLKSPAPPPMMTEPQDPIPDFRSMITDSYRREGVDDGFFDSEFYLNTFDGGGGIFGGPEGQVAAMSKYFGSGGSNSGSRDKAYENYLRATGQEDKIKTGHDYNDIGGNIFNLNPIQGNASAVGDGIFDVNGVQGTINATAPIQGNEPIDPGRHPSFYAQPGSPMSMARGQPSAGLGMDRGGLGMDQLFGRAFAGKPI